MLASWMLSRRLWAGRAAGSRSVARLRSSRLGRSAVAFDNADPLLASGARTTTSRSLAGPAAATPVASSKPTLPVGPQVKPREVNSSSTACRTCKEPTQRARGTWRQLRAAARSSVVTRSAMASRASKAAKCSPRVRPHTPTGMSPAGVHKRRTTTQGARHDPIAKGGGLDDRRRGIETHHDPHYRCPH